jgi:hypothetical protein
MGNLFPAHARILRKNLQYLAQAGRWSIVNNGKTGRLFTAVTCVNINAVVGDVIDISGFTGGFPVVKNPADFEFSLWRDDGGILENS